MKPRISRVLSSVVMASVFCHHAGAADITFDLTTGVQGQTSFSKTVSGYTLTFSNPSPSSFNGDTDGMYIDNNMNQFRIVLSGSPTDALLFKNYEVGFVSGLGALPFTLTGGTGTSANNSLANIGTFNFNGSFSIAQGQTVLFSSNTTSGGRFSQIKTMTFEIVPVPEPSTYALSAIATALLCYQAYRRRAKHIGTL